MEKYFYTAAMVCTDWYSKKCFHKYPYVIQSKASVVNACHE